MCSKKAQGKFEFAGSPFTVVEGTGGDEIIEGICESVFDRSLFGEGTDDFREEEISGREQLEAFLKKLDMPFTIVYEGYYIDRFFRDSFYMYFSNQHFPVNRYSQRLSFFNGRFDEKDYFSNGKGIEDRLQENFIGSCVINPLVTGTLGTSLISPYYAVDDAKRPVNMRLSRFKLHIYGKTLYVRAFPYRAQDGETMRCAEVALLNMLEYYANSYEDYRMVVPNEIIENERKSNHDRVLPSKGTTYPIMSKVLSELGFFPRLYSISAVDAFEFSSVSREDEFKRLLHYYVESGIPVAVNLSPIGGGNGHSIVCIGHGKYNEDSGESRAEGKKWIPLKYYGNGRAIINSADYYDEYVVVDDNTPFYQVREFGQLSRYSGMAVDNIVVPLYKRMFMDAKDAYGVIQSLLSSEDFGIINTKKNDIDTLGENAVKNFRINTWVGKVVGETEDVVIRLFMASSSGLKKSRTRLLRSNALKELYAIIPMPRFVWICELYRKEDYGKTKRAFGEIVIDATSAPRKGYGSLILIHYPAAVIYRIPQNTKRDFKRIIRFPEEFPKGDYSKFEGFEGYSENLEEIEKK